MSDIQSSTQTSQSTQNEPTTTPSVAMTLKDEYQSPELVEHSDLNDLTQFSIVTLSDDGDNEGVS